MGGMGLSHDSNQMPGYYSEMQSPPVQAHPDQSAQRYAQQQTQPVYMNQREAEDFLRKQSNVTASADGSEIGLFAL